MTAEFKDRLNQELNQFSIKLEDSQIIQFYEYYEILVEWNKVMNLTAITEQNEVITKHFVDSLALIKSVLKIAFPQLKVTLMDSLNKRVKFLNEVIEKLDLKEIQAVHSRAEDLGREKEYREKYDLSVSRAVANLSTLSEYCMPFVKPGGFFISYKSGKIEEELTSAKHAIFLLSGKVSGVESFTLDGADAERTLVKIEKVNEISKKYPRKAGVPAKEPLK